MKSNQDVARILIGQTITGMYDEQLLLVTRDHFLLQIIDAFPISCEHYVNESSPGDFFANLESGVEEVYKDLVSGRQIRREEMQAMLKYRPGDSQAEKEELPRSIENEVGSNQKRGNDCPACRAFQDKDEGPSNSANALLNVLEDRSVDGGEK